MRPHSGNNRKRLALNWLVSIGMFTILSRFCVFTHLMQLCLGDRHLHGFSRDNTVPCKLECMAGEEANIGY